MPQLIDIVATGGANQEATIEDGGVLYDLRMIWDGRLQSWVLDVEGVALCQRLSPGAILVRFPAGGVLTCVGDRDPYAFEDLGATLFVVYLTAAEAAAL